MTKLRICHLITELKPAGAERMVYELATRTDRDRFDVSVIALRGGSVADQLEKAGIPVDIVGLRCKYDVLRLRRVVKALRKYQPDILHTHLFHADVVGRFGAWYNEIPHLVHTVHVAEGRFRPWQFSFARFLSQGCERMICVSPSVRDFHMRRCGLPERAYQVIYNGIDPEKFSHDPASRSRLRAEWQLGEDAPIVGFVGRLDHQKGVDLLLSAMSHLAARGEGVNFVVAGEGPQQEIVENFARHGEGGSFCKYLGFVEDIRAIYSAVDIVVMPSRWEGFGLVAGEAMAAGLPVVATDAPGLRDVVVHDETGLVVEGTDPFALAESVQMLVDDPQLRETLGKAGRKRVMEEFSIDAMVKNHEDLYCEIAQDILHPAPKPAWAGWEE